MSSEKVVIVTGASQGIGAELVKAFRQRGYRVVATARSIKPIDDPDIATVAGDIGDPATARRVVATAVDAFRPRRLARQQRRHLRGKAVHAAIPSEDYAVRDQREPRRLLPYHAARHRRDGKAAKAATSSASPPA